MHACIIILSAKKIFHVSTIDYIRQNSKIKCHLYCFSVAFGSKEISIVWSSDKTNKIDN